MHVAVTSCQCMWGRLYVCCTIPVCIVPGQLPTMVSMLLVHVSRMAYTTIIATM